MNKLEHYATIIKHSNLHSIDRLQFPWLTASIVVTMRLPSDLQSLLLSTICSISELSKLSF